MARSKAISGGPVYLSDAPEMFAKENILPLIDTDGKLFRPVAPAVPTPESILINPLMDWQSLSRICTNRRRSSRTDLL